MLPVLVVLFLISYGLLTRLVVEQDRVIGYQLGLIKQMLTDSNELAALKGKLQHDQKQAQKQTPNRPQGTSPDSQVPEKSHPRSKQQSRRPKLLPEHPPIPASDAMDERRAQIKI